MPNVSVPPWLPLLNPSRLLAAAEQAAATQASGLANARPLLEPICSFYSEARDNFVKQVGACMLIPFCLVGWCVVVLLKVDRLAGSYAAAPWLSAWPAAPPPSTAAPASRHHP